ncbi:MAG: 16S rRNA (cytosine(1402)-N(4))-methyltransferase RsmH [Candidatus Taylorbacteria bacterium]|nr:16S rRNA (cytosine(1402)-N(4))-methyltransferase RsmH [Candidatus Taylorbacteria bacterium]
MGYTHKSVLLQEVTEGLSVKSGDIIIDGTLGGGGHSVEIAKSLGAEVRIIGLDLDQDALTHAKERLDVYTNNTSFHNVSFRHLDKVLEDLNIQKVNRIILDLGLSSNQFENSGRGFSFQKNEPLLMTFKKELGPEDLTAKEIVNTWDESNIADIIYGYGEERYARKIAQKIVEAREIKPIETTFDLVEIIKQATPKSYQHRKINPATKTFQALRITVNSEIDSLKEGLKKGFNSLEKNGRLAVISFHSLEDRIVKHYFKEKALQNEGLLLSKKPIISNETELQKNPRARSAKLRIIEKA